MVTKINRSKLAYTQNTNVKTLDVKLYTHYIRIWQQIKKGNNQNIKMSTMIVATKVPID